MNNARQPGLCGLFATVGHCNQFLVRNGHIGGLHAYSNDVCMRFSRRVLRFALCNALCNIPMQADKAAGLGAAKRGYVYFSEVKCIPVADMKTVDDLWKAYR